MKHVKVGPISILILTLAIAGCAKKSTEQASITGTGFDSITSEELAQLPQSSTTSQQAGVEVLPIETSPITQGVPPITGPTAARAQAAMSSMTAVAESTSLTREQLIQTALRNAGLYTGNIDGKIGPGSKRAIEQFQSNNGLQVDGKVGPRTWTALEPYVSGSVASTGTTSTTTSD